MKKLIFIIVLMSFHASFAQKAGTTYILPAVDIAAEKSKAIQKSKGPVKFGINTYIKDIKVSENKSTQGLWEEINPNQSKWKLQVQAENATSLDFGFKNFYLPPTAELVVYNQDNSVIRGPFNGSINKKHGYFWPGIVPGDFATIEITIDNRFKKYLNFELYDIPRGFYKFWETPTENKSLQCNIDVNCPEGDPWESQIKSVARYNFTLNGGQFLCTGQLINNTSQDGTPYFLTANHCGYEDAASQSQKDAIAASMNVWWNYQSQTCRSPGSSQSGIVISLSGFNDTQSGASHVANNAASDFALVELNQVPNLSFDTEYTGWDRRNVAPNSAVSIHHPKGHAKRIALENNPLSITSPLGIQGTHLTVNVWDEGLTEQGSSGGGLWNSDGLLVGQLHFGDLAQVCTDPVSDSFGRFFTSWDQGTTAQARLKEWLDPLNTGATTLQGSAGCEAPSIGINNNTSNVVGDVLALTSTVNGGSGGYTYQWDIDGDGITDGNDANIDVRYSKEFVGNVTLTVKDSSGCQSTTSQAVVIEGPKVELQDVQNIRENLDQVCGNNDNVIDPGERWKTTLFTENTGSQTATDAYLALSVAKATTGGDLSDNYGNTVSSCDPLFIDITNTGTVSAWIDGNLSDGYPANDEGHTAPIALSQTIDHFGENVASIVASSNGYLSTSGTATGVDWDNDCPLPQSPDKDNVGGRIYPMHEDLKSSEFYHQYFEECPRAAETGDNLACEVFYWKGADLWSTTTITENIDVQAILYPATSQWVYQYAGPDIDGSTATVGIQNSAGTDGLSYACNEFQSINNTEAVCIFNKNHQPPSLGAGFVRLETPLIELGDVSVNESQSSELVFSITTDATCGVDFSINQDATVYDEGFNPGDNNVFNGTIGNNGVCNVVTSCPVSTEDNFIEPKNGLWWNPQRAGNGTDMHVSNMSSLLYVMYTGRKDRSPVWYIAPILNDSYANQYYNNIFEISYPGGYGVGSQQSSQVGWSTTTFTDVKKAIQVRSINGELFAEKMVMDQFAADQTINNHTGHYFAPSEGGWGQSIITLDNTQVAIGYIYDLIGEPFWTIGSGVNDNSSRILYTAETFCPTCAWTSTDVHQVGTISQSFNGQIDGNIVDFSVEYPMGASQPSVQWQRNDVDTRNLVPQTNATENNQ